MDQNEGTAGVQREVARAAERITDDGRRAAAAVKAEAGDLAATARDVGVRQAEAGREQIADRLESFADNVQEVSQGLREREAWLADLLDKGARELSHLAGTLHQRDLGSLVGSVESFARRQPALFAGATVALGFAAARLAKSSSERRHERAETAYAQATDDRTYAGPTSADRGYALHEGPVMGGGFAPPASRADRPEGDPL